MALLDASGTANGTSGSSASTVVQMAVAASFEATSDCTISGGVNLLVGATFQGSSAFDWKYFVASSAEFAGSSSMSASCSTIQNVGAVATGSARFFYNAPFVIQSRSFFTVDVVVDHQFRALRAITMGPKTFRWLQPLQRGDLPVFICDRHSPIIPYRVSYKLIQLRRDGSRKDVGPQRRVPVAGDVGEFYATGNAGEAGQAGQWIIEWAYQRSRGAPIETSEMRFQVLDAVAFNDPRERLVRKIKFGWS